MAKKNLFKIALSMVLALVMCLNATGVSAWGRPGGGSTAKSITVYTMLNPESEGSFSATFDGSAWTGGATLSKSDTAGVEVTVTPAAGYRVLQIDMLCTGGGNNDKPLRCRTYNENASYSVSASKDADSLSISGFTANSACNHASGSTLYYMMVTLEKVDTTKTYTVTYTPGTGNGTAYTDPTPYTVKAAVDVMSETDLGFTKAGHIFAGWKVTSCTDTNPLYNHVGKTFESDDTFAMPAGDIVLTALWEIPEVPVYAVTYEYAGEVPEGLTPPAGGTFEAGAPVTVADAPAIPEGYTFSGWDTEDFEMPAKDVVITGTWALIPEYSVTYEYAGDVPAGYTAPVDSGTYPAGAPVTVADAPVIPEGYTFSGWDTEDFEMPAKDVVITGTWALIPEYTVTYAYEGDIPEGFTPPAGGTYYENDTVDVAAFPIAPNGYRFLGWDTDDFTMPAKNVVITGVWEIIPEFSVTYVYEGDIPEGFTAPVDSGTYPEGAPVTVLAEPEAPEGYEFGGWSKKNFVMPGENVVITGVWYKLPTFDFTVIYKGNFEGAPEDITDDESVTGIYENIHEFKIDENTFVNPNHTFAGWAVEPEGEVVLTPGADIALTDDHPTLTLYAKWTENDKYSYTLTYNGNGGEVDGLAAIGDEENAENVYDTSKTMEINVNTFAREGYTFLEWNTAPDGMGQTYEAETSVKLVPENNALTLYAIWEAIPVETPDPEPDPEPIEYGIYYNANIYWSVKNDSENEYNSFKSQLGMTVDECVFTAEGYTFSHWSTRPDGGDIYLPGDAVILTPDNNVLYLYAQWTAVPEESEEPVPHDIDEEIPEDDDEELVDLEDEDVPLADVPETFDPTTAIAVIAAASGIALAAVAKKKED